MSGRRRPAARACAITAAVSAGGLLVGTVAMAAGPHADDAGAPAGAVAATVTTPTTTAPFRQPVPAFPAQRPNTVSRGS